MHNRESRVVITRDGRKPEAGDLFDDLVCMTRPDRKEKQRVGKENDCRISCDTSIVRYHSYFYIC